MQGTHLILFCKIFLVYLNISQEVIYILNNGSRKLGVWKPAINGEKLI